MMRGLVKYFLVVALIISYVSNFYVTSVTHASTQIWSFDSSSDYSFDNSKIEITAGKAQLKPQDAWYDSDWGYRIPITVTNGGASTLTDYKVQVDLSSSNFDFTKALTNAEDIRFTSVDGITLIPFGTQSYNSAGETAALWPEIASLPTGDTTIYMYYGNSNASPYDYFKFSLDSTTHANYGAAFPLTYQFAISSTASSLKAYKKYTQAGEWTQIATKTTGDYYNDIDAARFDYDNDKAYVSVAFAASSISDDLYIKITNDSDQTAYVNYEGITEYYDNRTAVITASSDDWDGNSTLNTAFLNTADQFINRYMYLTVGITTQGIRQRNNPSLTTSAYWDGIQGKLNSGYIEAASHGREHTGAGEGTSSFFKYKYTGTHTGDNDAADLTDSAATFPVDGSGYTRNLVGWTIDNTTDESSCVITASTDTSITCTLSGGTDNNWDTNDAYEIDHYDEEVGGSAQDIKDNLVLPRSNGDSEYVYTYLEPFGYSDATLRSKIGEYKYLADRQVNSNVSSTTTDYFWPTWDNTNSVYNRNTPIYKYGSDSPIGSTTTAQTRFLATVQAGGIYHLWGHPAYGDPFTNTKWTSGAGTDEWGKHLDLIQGSLDGSTRRPKDVENNIDYPNFWYVNYGYLFLYHYLHERDLVSYVKVCDSKTSTKSAVVRDDFGSGISTSSDIWNNKLQYKTQTAGAAGNMGTAVISSGNLTLSASGSSATTASVRTVNNNFNTMETRLKGGKLRPMLALSIGNGSLVQRLGTVAPNRLSYSNFYNGYTLYFGSDDETADLLLKKSVNGVESTLATYASDGNARQLEYFHYYRVVLTGSGVKVYRSQNVTGCVDAATCEESPNDLDHMVEIISSDDTTFSSGAGLISVGELGTGWGDPVTIDYVEMSQQNAATEPTTSASDENSYYPSDDPAIYSNDSVDFTSLSGFSETTSKNDGEIKYIISSDEGASWYYYASGWTGSDNSYSQASTASEIDDHIDSLPVGLGKFLFKAFLSSNGAQQVNLDAISLAYENDTTSPTVSAGLDKITNAVFTQTAAASDDGSGIDVSSYQWTKVSGPGTITFGSATSLSTAISASQDGVYIIRFSVSDNAGNNSSDDMIMVWRSDSVAAENINGNSPVSLVGTSSGLNMNYSSNQQTETIGSDLVPSVTEYPAQDIDAKEWFVKISSDEDGVQKALNANQIEEISSRLPVFRGHTMPFASITIEINSENVIISHLTADKYGDWKYSIAKPLDLGEHTVKITIKDADNDNIISSDVYRFKIVQDWRRNFIDFCNKRLILWVILFFVLTIAAIYIFTRRKKFRKK